MRIRLAVVLGAIAALAFAAVAVAAPAQWKITGGGQTFAGSQVADGKPTVKGPGDTITFQAFLPNSGVSEAADLGQVNIIDRQVGQPAPGKGKGEHFRGVVTCAFLSPKTDQEPAYAELRGHNRYDSDDFFVVRIVDNGLGGAAENDAVQFDLHTDDDPNTPGAQRGACEDFETDEVTFQLARGNAKIHKQSPSQSGGSQKSAAGTSVTRSLTSGLTLR